MLRIVMAGIVGAVLSGCVSPNKAPSYDGVSRAVVEAVDKLACEVDADDHIRKVMQECMDKRGHDKPVVVVHKIVNNVAAGVSDADMGQATIDLLTAIRQTKKFIVIEVGDYLNGGAYETGDFMLKGSLAAVSGAGGEKRYFLNLAMTDITEERNKIWNASIRVMAE